ncbi:MAG TPA: hypothetical protein VNY27_07175 [Solirubrobacteraceae bacterium]|nr:hypothetical protein [Solirubrobacteraceae bacterium]
MSARLPGGAGSGATAPSAPGVLRVEAVFHDVASEQADTIAAELIARAHELANLPECGCDVDVNVQQSPPEGDGARSNGAL